MPGVKTEKLTSTDAFIVFDLEGSARNAGVTRAAPKILADGAALLARTATYQFASFEMQIGGASAGINAKPDVRADAIRAFVTEVEPFVQDGRFCTDPGKGVDEGAFAALAAVDPRDPMYARDGVSLLGMSVTAAAGVALGGALDGRTFAFEHFDRNAAAIATLVAARGAKVVGVATADGAVADPQGLDPVQLGVGLAQHGAAFVTEMGRAVEPAPSVLVTPCDVLCAGSKAGIIDHEAAAGITAEVVLPTGAVPVTAKALAVLRRAGVTVLPDFVTTAGPIFAAWPPEGAGIAQVRAQVTEQVTAVLSDVLAHEDGPLLAACYRAEAFLRTWQETLPFGRPLA